MKKILSVFLALCLSATVMCSCNTAQTSENVQNSQATETSQLSSEETQNTDSESSGDTNQDSDQQSSNSNSGEPSKTSQASQTSQTSEKPSNNTSNNTSSKPSNNNTSNNTSNNQSNNNTSNNTTGKPSSNTSNNTSNNQNSTPSNNTSSKPSNNISNNTTSKPSNSTSNNTNNNQNNNNSNNTGNVSDKEQEEIYNALFDINSKVNIKIDISDAELNKIQQDYDKYKKMNSKSPIYRVASKVTFTINGKKYEIEDVGIRMKGNTTRESFYNSSGMYNLVHFRLSFDETFDDTKYYGSQAKKWNDADRKQRKKRTFATLNGLEIKWNVNYDQTYVREYYTSQMYRENGILCARNSISQINIAGHDMGVYMIYEPVDNNFIERNLPEKDWDGDLYKVGWTNSPADYTTSVRYGIEDEDKAKFYNFDLKTNKKKSTHQSLKTLLNTINKSGITKADFEKVVDMDYFIKFTALSYFIGSPDDMRNNYNNHYVYFRKSDGKAIFIPYDNDRSFGICCGYNPTGNGMTTVSPFSNRAEGNYSDQRNRLFRKTVQDGGLYLNEYKAELKKIASSKWVKFSNFKAVYEIAKSHYNNCTKPDKYYQNADSSRLTFSLDGKLTNGDKYNLSVEDYFTRKLNTYNKYK